MQKIVVTITPDGMKIDAEGFTGGQCIVEQDALENYLRQKGIEQTGKQQKKKLEQMYSSAPGHQVKY